MRRTNATTAADHEGTTMTIATFDLYYAMTDAQIVAELDRRGISYYPEVTRFAAVRMLIVDDRTNA